MVGQGAAVCSKSCVVSIVVYRPVARQLIGKHVFAATGETECCLRGPRKVVINKRIGAIQLVES
jgi:hypothetical protein